MRPKNYRDVHRTLAAAELVRELVRSRAGFRKRLEAMLATRGGEFRLWAARQPLPNCPRASAKRAGSVPRAVPSVRRWHTFPRQVFTSFQPAGLPADKRDTMIQI